MTGQRASVSIPGPVVTPTGESCQAGEPTHTPPSPNLTSDATTPSDTWIAPRRSVRTYHDELGREIYDDTGRPADERLGSHVVLWIVDDAEAWAAAVEREADAELAGLSKRERGRWEWRRRERYESAAQIRAEGPCRTVYSHDYGAAAADSCVAELRRAHPNPGVRYEAVPITNADACPDCHTPRIHAGGQWWHHLLRYPTDCLPEPEPEPERQDGEWEISPGAGTMTCGYCDDTVMWAHSALGYRRLTGNLLLAIDRSDGRLVVPAEAVTPNGTVTGMPHACTEIPDEVLSEFAEEIRAAQAAVAHQQPGGNGHVPSANRSH